MVSKSNGLTQDTWKNDPKPYGNDSIPAVHTALPTTMFGSLVLEGWGCQDCQQLSDETLASRGLQTLNEVNACTPARMQPRRDVNDTIGTLQYCAGSDRTVRTIYS